MANIRTRILCVLGQNISEYYGYNTVHYKLCPQSYTSFIQYSNYQSKRITYPGTRESLLLTRESLLSTRESLLPTRESLLPTRESLIPTIESLNLTSESLHPTRESLHLTSESLLPTEVLQRAQKSHFSTNCKGQFTTCEYFDQESYFTWFREICPRLIELGFYCFRELLLRIISLIQRAVIKLFLSDKRAVLLYSVHGDISSFPQLRELFLTLKELFLPADRAIYYS